MYIHDVRWFIGSLMERGGTHKHTVEDVHATHNKNHTSAGGPSLIAYLNKFINDNN